METSTYVEKYVKRTGGKYYCVVHFKIGKTNISVGEFQTDDTDKAIRLAKEVMDTAVELF